MKDSLRLNLDKLKPVDGPISDHQNEGSTPEVSEDGDKNLKHGLLDIGVLTADEKLHME